MYGMPTLRFRLGRIPVEIELFHFIGAAMLGINQSRGDKGLLWVLLWILVVVVSVLAHEIGHALGMPAGTADLHRPTDQPAWIMDSGGARPWAERAGLAGAPPAQWGPLDAAYLGQILPRSQQVYPK